MPSSVNAEVLNEVFKNVMGGNVEFFYDQNYILNEFKNHVSVQLSEPLQFSSMEEVTEECESLPSELNEVFGEEVEVISCQVAPSNSWLVFHHAYTLTSQGVTIISEAVRVNQEYSLLFVGGSGNDLDGLHRVRSAQQSLIDALTEYLNDQTGQNQ